MMNIKRELKKESRNVPDIRERVKSELGIEKQPKQAKRLNKTWQYLAIPICAVAVVAIVLSVVLIPKTGDNVINGITQTQANYGKAAIMAFDVMNGISLEAGSASYESNLSLVEQVNGYIKSFEKYLDDSVSISLIDKDKANGLKIVSGSEEYFFRYNANEGNEKAIEGIFTVGEQEYFTEARVGVEEEKGESTQYVFMTMYYGKSKGDSYIQLEYEIENEKSEKESVLKYYVYSDNVLIEQTEIETEIEANERSVEIFIAKGEKIFKYSYEIEDNEAELVIEESGKPQISCKLIFSESGNIYKFDGYDEIVIDD